jgi:hypothetical protein
MTVIPVGCYSATISAFVQDVHSAATKVSPQEEIVTWISTRSDWTGAVNRVYLVEFDGAVRCVREYDPESRISLTNAGNHADASAPASAKAQGLHDILLTNTRMN